MILRRLRASGRGAAASWAAVSAVLLTIACSGAASAPPPYRWGVTPEALPDVVHEADWPELPLGSVDRIWGVAGKDLRGKDLSALSLAFLAALTFDDNTRWPEQQLLPASFSAERWTAVAKDPGLGVRDLHRQGITGRGVVVAVVDKPIRTDHVEFGGRLRYHEVFDDMERGHRPHFHGIACASILAGRTVGVAPEATVHYFATPDVGQNFHFYALAAARIIEVNQSLDEDRRIRLVSISDGLSPDNPYREEWEAAERRLEEAGIAVVYSARHRLQGFTWGGAAPYVDRSVGTDYTTALFLRGRDVPRERIVIPADYRATASNHGRDVYMYWGEGGWSWAISYAAGLAALAWQIQPSLTFAEIEDLLRETAGTTSTGQGVLAPTAFIEAVRQWGGSAGR